MRRSHGTRGATTSIRIRTLAMLVVLVACLWALAPVAHAQVDPCIADPASCLPDAPEVPDVPDVPDVDPCLADPQSCLPPLPDPEGCAADPASCLPPPPDPDQCLEDPQSCLPVEDPGLPDPDDVVDDVERCVADPDACLDGAGATPDHVADCVADPKKCLSETSEPLDDLFLTLDEVLAANGVEAADLVGAGRVDADLAQGIGDGSPGAGENARTSSGDAPSGELPASLFESGPDDRSAGGLLDDIGDIFGDIIDRFGFPLALVAIAAMFLAIQNRLDRKDPKLALAPVDSTHELLTFK